jgi:hypothetical protein
MKNDETLLTTLRRLTDYFNEEDRTLYPNQLELCKIVLDRIADDLGAKKNEKFLNEGFNNLYFRVYADNPYEVGSEEWDLFNQGEREYLNSIN